MILNLLVIQSTLKDMICNYLSQDINFQEIIKKVQVAQVENFLLNDEKLLKYQGRIYVPNFDKLREEILSEAHLSAIQFIQEVIKCIKNLEEYFGSHD